jgi:hypothetical protein
MGTMPVPSRQPSGPTAYSTTEYDPQIVQRMPWAHPICTVGCRCHHLPVAAPIPTTSIHIFPADMPAVCVHNMVPDLHINVHDLAVHATSCQNVDFPCQDVISEYHITLTKDHKLFIKAAVVCGLLIHCRRPNIKKE